MKSSNNPILESGLPRFFKVSDFSRSTLDSLDDRYGDSLRTWARSLSHMQKEAIVSSARTGNTWRLVSDEGAYLDGLDEAPCPLCFMTTGMVAGTMNSLTALAKERGIVINDLRLIQDNYYTMQGSMLRGTMTGGAKDVELEVQIDAEADEGSIQSLVQDALNRAPIAELMQTATPSLFGLSHNEQVLSPTEVNTFSNAFEAFLSTHFDALTLDRSPVGELVRNSGQMTPKLSHTTSFQGSSLQEEQNRLLHIRGICTLKDDGLKRIEQHLFNPHGSVYHLLSDEAEGFGGQGRAPDASTYLSAGIAFCFMTQFGRAASIFKKPLERYDIIQDTFFSPLNSSASSVAADAVETHVALVSEFDDEYAQHVLSMAEQTCFLHALCRDTITTKFVVNSFTQ